MLRARALVDEVWREVTYAVRGLLRNKGFAALAIATVGIGVAASAAIFSLVDTVVFRSLPYADPSRLVRIASTLERQPADPDVSWADFVDLTAQQDVFERVAADDGGGLVVRIGDGPREAVGGAMVTSAWLDTLGVTPLLGRRFLAEDFDAGSDRVALLAHTWWVRRFGADPATVGRTIIVDDQPFTIIGVLPPNVLRFGADMVRPLIAADYPQSRAHRDLDVVARLKPGVTLARAQAALDTVARRLALDHPETNARRGFRAAPLGKYYASLERQAEPGLLLMLGAVALVLLVACTNVTNLILARTVTRARECLVRTALGASRGRLVRQLLVETSVLFLAGGALGIVVARWSLEALLAFAIAGGYVPERLSVVVDARILAISLGVCLTAALLSGLSPALQASRLDLSSALKASGPTTSGGPKRRRARRLLIVAELAMTFVLLVGAGLLVRSLLHLRATPSGIDPTNLLLTASDGGRDFPAAVAYWQRALERTETLPGVRAAAITSRPPIHDSRSQRFLIEGEDQPAAAGRPRADDILISAGYFATTGIPILQGRAFSDRDGAGAAPVALVSQSFARRYFPGVSPLGRRISLIEERSTGACCSAAGPVEGVWREIVGVVADVRQASLEEAPAMTIYRPFTQLVEHDMYLLVRARSAPNAGSLAARLRAHLVAMEPMHVWAEVRFMHDIIDASSAVRVRRFVLTLLAGFGGLAMLLTAAGIAGVMAYVVAERTRELGIRIALGASRIHVLRDVFGEALMLAGAALVIGALAAQLATRFIASLLIGIGAMDVVTYAGAALVLVIVVLVATGLPARRAARVDPLIALRHE
jgi:putative ABC transport system permease protein